MHDLTTPAESSTTALPYATPTASRPGSVGAAAVLAFTGLGLILFGGCFCIGILFFHLPAIFGGMNGAPPPTVWTSGKIVFVFFLYLLATVCVAGGISVLVMTIRRLLRLLST
jgi:hypothetical protein